MRTVQLPFFAFIILSFVWAGCTPEESKTCTNTFTDERDGEVYCITTIGAQTWMAENLRYQSDSAYHNKNFPNTVNSEYGLLYPYQEALKVCPNGWHLPTDDEWKTLETSLGMTSAELVNVNERGTDEGDQLKAIDGWDATTNSMVAPTDAQGFKALPAGEYNPSFGPFFNLGSHAKFWTATVFDSTGGAWMRALSYDEPGVRRSYFSQKNGFSCRCVQD